MGRSGEMFPPHNARLDTECWQVQCRECRNQSDSFSLYPMFVSLLAQGLNVFEAAKMGVLIHSLAADQNAKAFGERGLLASDLLHHLRSLVN